MSLPLLRPSLRPVLAVLPSAQAALPAAAVAGSPGLFSPAELADIQRRTTVAGDAAVRTALLRSMMDAAASLPPMCVPAAPATEVPAGR